MEECEDFSGSNSVTYLIEFLTAEEIPPFDIHRYMQAVYGNKCVDVSTDAGYGKKKCGKQLYVTKSGRGGQDGIQKVVKL